MALQFSTQGTGFSLSLIVKGPNHKVKCKCQLAILNKSERLQALNTDR